jgi:hypothetical protein
MFGLWSRHQAGKATEAVCDSRWRGGRLMISRRVTRSRTAATTWTCRFVAKRVRGLSLPKGAQRKARQIVREQGRALVRRRLCTQRTERCGHCADHRTIFRLLISRAPLRVISCQVVSPRLLNRLLIISTYAGRPVSLASCEGCRQLTRPWRLLPGCDQSVPRSLSGRTDR